MAYSRRKPVGRKRVTQRRRKGGAAAAPSKQILISGYQGADVFIINHKDGDDHLILVEQKDNQGRSYFELPGGRCETVHTKLEDTIHQELWEETRKSVSISVPVFERMTAKGKFVDYPGGEGGLPGNRKCFVCRADFISTTLYNQNKAIFDLLTTTDNNKAQGKQPGHYKAMLHSFLETDSMKRVKLSVLEASIKQGDDGRKREITDGKDKFWVGKFAMRAYIGARAKGLIAKPFKLSDAPVKHHQRPNNNRFKDATKELVGKCDFYE